MKALLSVAVSFFIACIVSADELPLKNGRYLGSVIVFKLSSSQRQAINHFRTCHLEKYQTMNVYTPYVFSLEPDQTSTLKTAKGFSPRYFEVYETFRGFNEAGPHWNLALRFSEDEIEIPVDLLVPEKDSIESQKELGWEPKNPCFPQVGNK
jgi:hypothetical protein